MKSSPNTEAHWYAVLGQWTRTACSALEHLRANAGTFLWPSQK